MPSTEVQRTLVKSPPELWAELSDPASLARHLGEFGEIRIAHVEPESTVEWEAGSVRGAVELKPSGWGTKVTLIAVREPPAVEPPAVESPQEQAPSEPQAMTEPKPGPEPIAEPEPAGIAEPEPEDVAEPEPENIAAPEPELEPGPRPRLLARIFRRWRRERLQAELEPKPDAEPVTGPEPEPRAELAAEPHPTSGPGSGPSSTPEPVLTPQPHPTPEPEPVAEDRPNLAAELAQIEAAIVEQDTALLSAVLDRLGAAHHRPFSRG